MHSTRRFLLSFLISCGLGGYVFSGTSQAEGKSDVAVTLDSAGAAPRRTLRIQAPKGLSETMVMTMNIGMRMTGLPSNAVPTMVTESKMVVDRVEANGDRHLSFTVTAARVLPDPSVSPAVQKVVEASLAPMVGMGGSWSINDRGFLVGDVNLSLPDNLPPAMQSAMAGMRESMKQLMAPLPDKAVGVGAKWTTTMPMNMNGMSMTQHAHFSVTSIRGSAVATRVSIEQKAKPQTIRRPNMPEVELLSMHSTGSGTVNFDTKSLVPTSNLSITSDMEMRAVGQTMNMQMKMEMTIRKK